MLASDTSTLHLHNHVAELERNLILLALERSGGSQRQAAKLLDISRNALARKIKLYQIELP